jgi:pimeloyl-ACP methyl ester carboxylesterase
MLLTIALLSGCTAMPSMGATAARSQAYRTAEAAGLSAATIDVHGFRLQVFHRGLAGAHAVNVYIEGDGRAWSSPHRPADDPTPRDPVALELAARDRSAAVLYLARPCQFQDRAALPACDRKFWTTHRYAGEVVDAMDQAIDLALRQAGADEARVSLGLIGYSGGGAVAALVAARRAQARWLVTVTGNLDHREWTRIHDVTPLSASLNAADFAASLRALPQVHLIGGKDRIVPRAVTQSYLRQAGHAAKTTLIEIADYDHQCCWAESWPDLACAALSTSGATFTPCN